MFQSRVACAQSRVACASERTVANMSHTVINSCEQKVSTVKCNSCNIVINEVLAFLCNKIDVMDEDSICRICETAFSESDIVIAKNLLYESIPSSKKKTRKRKGKTVRDTEDIVCLLKETDPDIIPIFVARELHKLPPVLFDHLDATRILKDLVKMRQDLDRMAVEYVRKEELITMKSDINCLQRQNKSNHINYKRGACLINSPEFDSGPVGLFPVETTTENIITPEEGSSTYLCTPKVSNEPVDGADAALSNKSAMNQLWTAPSLRPAPSPCTELPCAQHVNIDPSASSAKTNMHTTCTMTFAKVTKQVGEWKSEKKSEEWKEVQRKRHRNRLMGSKGTAPVEATVNFRAADVSIPIYIYNVSKQTNEKDILTYIREKTNTDVKLIKWNMKKEKAYCAYKIFVPHVLLDTFLSDEFWPEGVSFRRFINFHRKEETHKTTGEKPSQNIINNGQNK